MSRYLKEGQKSNYDKFPVVNVPGYENACLCGWNDIMEHLRSEVPASGVLVLECYQGVHDAEVLSALKAAFPQASLYLSADAMKSQEQLHDVLKDDITEDEIFGYMTRYTIDVYFDAQKVE